MSKVYRALGEMGARACVCVSWGGAASPRVLARVLAVALLALAMPACRGTAPTVEGDPGLAAIRRDVEARRVPALPRLAIGPVEVAYAFEREADPDPTRAPFRVDPTRVRQALTRGLVEAGLPAAMRADGIDRAEVLAAAWADGAEVLVEPTLARLDGVFRGRNWRYAPNLFLFFYAWVPSFWVPDETFGIEGELALRFVSAASGRVLFERAVRLEGEWPLDDFERGWTLTGIITAPSSIDASGWALVSESLAPLVDTAVARACAEVLARDLAPQVGTPAWQEGDATVHALVVGVSRHAAGAAGPAGAGADAERIAALMTERLDVPAKNVHRLTDHEATREAVDKALADLRARSRAGDTILLYWSGTGAAQPRPASAGASSSAATGAASAAAAASVTEPALLPFEADRALPLFELREALAAMTAARVVVVLDASFGRGSAPGARSLRESGALDPARVDDALARFTARGAGLDVLLFAAAGPGEDAIDLAPAGRGLFSLLLEEGALGAADTDKDGAVDAGELLGFLEREVPAQAGLDQVEQHPRLYRAGRRVRAADPAARTPWLVAQTSAPPTAISAP